MSPAVYIVTALGAEARPLARYWHLEQETLGPYRVFSSDRIRLIASGVGRSASAAGAAFLYARESCPEHGVWLNFGVAGAASLDDGTTAQRGDLVWGARIVDESTRLSAQQPWRQADSWFPPLPTLAPANPCTIRTVHWVEREYPEAGAYEMEAAGFMGTASRFATAELVHVAKVISDTPEAPVDELDRHAIESLVEASAERLDAAITRLCELREELARLELPGEWVRVFQDRWRFTVTQHRALERLLRRWRALDPEPPAVSTLDASSARQCLRALEAALASKHPSAITRQPTP